MVISQIANGSCFSFKTKLTPETVNGDLCKKAGRKQFGVQNVQWL